jgi:hypothetical protein
MQYQVSNFVNCLGMPDTQAQMRFPSFTITDGSPYDDGPQSISAIIKSQDAKSKINALKSRCNRLGPNVCLANDMGFVSLPLEWKMTLSSHDTGPEKNSKVCLARFSRKTSFSPLSPSQNGPLLSQTAPKIPLLNALTAMRAHNVSVSESIQFFWSFDGNPILTLTQYHPRGLWSRSAIVYIQPTTGEAALELVWKSPLTALGCRDFLPLRRPVLSPMDAELFGRCFAEKHGLAPVFSSDYEEINPVRGSQNTAKFSLFSKRLAGNKPSFMFSAFLGRLRKTSDLNWFTTMRLHYTLKELEEALPQHWGLAAYLLK